MVNLPPCVKPFFNKCLYRIKRNSNGTMVRFKARLVANRFFQVFGEDFARSFAPIAMVVTVRVIFAIVAQNKWFIHQLDINNTFLHDILGEDIYLTPHPGYKLTNGQVCKLKKKGFILP